MQQFILLELYYCLTAITLIYSLNLLWRIKHVRLEYKWDIDARPIRKCGTYIIYIYICIYIFFYQTYITKSQTTLLLRKSFTRFDCKMQMAGPSHPHQLIVWIPDMVCRILEIIISMHLLIFQSSFSCGLYFTLMRVNAFTRARKKQLTLS